MSTVVLDPVTIAPPASVAAPVRSRRWLGLFAILAATIMNLLDTTVVNVGAPAIQASLGGSYTSLQWVAASYTLAMALGLLTGGRLGDMFGRRRVLLVGVVGFVAASLLCAVAWSPESLIAARVVQGLFAAVMVPQGFGLIRDLFPPHEIGKAFGTFGPIIGFSTILGPVVAGALIDADLFGTGWRMVFAINLPLGLFALLAGRAALPKATAPRTRTRLDVTGALTAAIGLLLLVFPLMQGREQGWPVWTFAMMAAAVPVLVAFALRQIRRAGSGRDPLVELRVFTRRSYASGVLFVIFFFGAIAGFSLAVGMFLQLVLGYSPMKASLTMAAWAVGAFIGSGFGSTMMNRLGRHILHIGLALMLVGTAALYPVFQLDNLGVRQLLVPLLVYGIGMGMIFVPLFGIIMGEVRDDEVGSAAGILESLQQLGAVLGVAVLGTVFFARIDVGVERVTLIALALTAITFALGFLLPRKARA
ncbi:putative actinorhodin transporter [Asanoa ishikariensis]|uniref:Drug resistance transporter, EmrB/QacA subfamily n=1 Tax=Asanoa ishikariensis TaxID=137265 RepID=A0A1H3QJH3_9ACTN|nr:MFS transporter [Asanoa ishikariensis]GIF64985.1 putative actinorhodin transporter [Asanoa ishikariensis]SDZ13251.1 drug resistance transporter, EmrB/QacA subfamily [Asanoa ishikariensis]